MSFPSSHVASCLSCRLRRSEVRPSDPNEPGHAPTAEASGFDIGYVMCRRSITCFEWASGLSEGFAINECAGAKAQGLVSVLAF